MITITVDGSATSIDSTTTAAELFARLRPGVDPKVGYWILARSDGGKYIENPGRKDTLVSSLFGEDEESPDLYIEQPEKCMHGSPGIRNRGFLCGWC